MMYIDDDGAYVIDGERYVNVNEAYRAFKRLHNKLAGKVASRRIGAKERKSVLSHRGFDFEEGYAERLRQEFEGTGKVRCYVLGRLGLSYIYIFDDIDYEARFCDDDNDRRERYLDWLLSSKTTGVMMCGRMDRLVMKGDSGGYVSNRLKHYKKKK